jgi:hypothetical protein
MILMLATAALMGFGNTAWAANRYTKEQLNARYYFDLGPAAIDVSTYPKIHRENYKVFTQDCSKCHTLARAINSPLIARSDWDRHIRRMYIEAQVAPDKRISLEDAKEIIDFLAYDSHRRKVERREEFAAETRRLKTLFADVQKEVVRLQIQKNKRDTRAPTLGEDAQPAPRTDE